MTLTLTPLHLGLLLAAALAAAGYLAHHQRRLKRRANLMREAMRNHDFTFSLPIVGWMPGERALLRTLNELGQDIRILVARNEVESWQRLTRVLTHEIMNATAPICSISQLLLENPPAAASDYKEGILTIHNMSNHLFTFVENYRKLTQMQRPMRTAVDLSTFAARMQATHPSLTWKTEIPRATMVHTDAQMLTQVVLNLVKNAVEAGATAVCLQWAGSSLLVSNNGRNIPAEVARNIFIPFFTTKSQGSGIGLPLSRQLMIHQGGDLALLDTPVAGYHVSFCISFGEQGPTDPLNPPV